MKFWKKKASDALDTSTDGRGGAGTAMLSTSPPPPPALPREQKPSRKAGRDRSNKSSSDNNDAKTSVFRVQIPEGYTSGREFQVFANNRIVRVRCPPNSKPGQFLSITVPAEPNTGTTNNTATPHHRPHQINGHQAAIPPDSPNVEKLEEGAYMCEIPATVRGGQQFPVMIAGMQLMVTAPPNARPGTKVRIEPPPLPPPPPPSTASTSAAAAAVPPLPTSTTSAPSSNNGVSDEENAAETPSTNSRRNLSRSSSQDDGGEKHQKYEIVVPPGVQPGKPFALLAGGVRILVTCPLNARPGQKIRFLVPLALTQKPTHQSEAATIKLQYDKDGWTRTIRLSDMQFQWVRMDDKGDIEGSQARFDPEKSAYVRLLEFRSGPDARIRDGTLSLVPANEAFVDSRIHDDHGHVVVTYSDIAEAQVRKYEEKVAWFQEMCMKLCVEWHEGHMRINVRRDHLLEDSIEAILSLSRKDMRKLWRFEFIGEEGIDAGGLAREWFQLVSAEMFDPNMGFWQSSEANQMCSQINPASSLIHEDYLIYYRFLGRVMGKALFDRQLIAGHCVQYVYKHILGWPITLKDIKSIDEEYYNNLRQLQELVNSGQDLEMLCLDFTQTTELMGVKEDTELVEGGASIDVTNDNFPEYLEACLKHRMLERVRSQLNELLLGFFDVIPEPLLTVFDFQELELLMCGLPEIDLEDWKEHTEYSGDYEQIGGDHPACIWFWEVVHDFDREMKARLLQFVTATSGVPSGGFGVLQGNDGNIRKFTIHGVSVDVCLYPRAHTCFNRIDLPIYDSKEDLREKLKLAVTMVATGFDIE